MGWSRGRGRDGAEEEVLQLVRDNAAQLLRFARRFSLCADDAQDAYQRALEILLRRMRDEPPENPLSWLRTVIRHECGAVRDQRLRDVAREELDLDRHEAGAFDDPADRVERFEQLAHAAEALRRLKPQEVTALALRAEGLTYQEICARTGWSYTRTNRVVTEGRRALLARLRAIESGAECDRWVPLLSLLADGEASARDLADLRPHLRSCGACRATLRRFHDAPRQIGELVPVALLPTSVAAIGGTGPQFGIGRYLEGLTHTFSERVATGAMRMQGAIDALPATKMAVVAASTAALAGGGAAIDRVTTRSGDRAQPPVSATTVAADQGSAGSPFLGAGATTRPIVGLSGPRAAAPVASGPSSRQPAAAAAHDEFGFEAARPRGDGGRDRARPAIAGAARSVRDKARRSTVRRPAEFPAAPPATAAAATAAASGAAEPPPAQHQVPPPPPASPPPASRTAQPDPPAEFAGP